jgi:alkylation response protein AidB-like acyl-CoA dehydrogenase
VVGDLERIHSDVVGWLRSNWDPELTIRQWWRLLAESGYAVPHWPTQWFGLGMGPRESAVIRRAIASERVPGPPAGIGMMMAAPTILAHGSDAQKSRYLPGIVTGESNWCQLFSEPEAGSDLAGLRATARRDGDRWIVNGQKVWTSNGHLADMAMLLARTDSKAPKHRGITWFACEMDQAGVEVRPLREITGRTLFNEVFLTDVVVRDDAIVGDVNDGWAVARTTLASERAALSAGAGSTGGIAGEKAGKLDSPAGGLAERLNRPRGTSGTSLALRGKSFGLLRDLAADRDRLADPAVRSKLVDLYCHELAARHLQSRAQDARSKGQTPGPESSIGKLMGSAAARMGRDLALQILGAHGMLDGPDAPGDGLFQEMALFSTAVSIYGGSDEIQRNVLAERVLGLPRESTESAR